MDSNGPKWNTKWNCLIYYVFILIEHTTREQKYKSERELFACRGQKYCDAARNVNKVRVRIFNEPTDYSSVANPTHRNYKET